LKSLNTYTYVYQLVKVNTAITTAQTATAQTATAQTATAQTATAQTATAQTATATATATATMTDQTIEMATTGRVRIIPDHLPQKDKSWLTAMYDAEDNESKAYLTLCDDSEDDFRIKHYVRRIREHDNTLCELNDALTKARSGSERLANDYYFNELKPIFHAISRTEAKRTKAINHCPYKVVKNYFVAYDAMISEQNNCPS